MRLAIEEMCELNDQITTLEKKVNHDFEIKEVIFLGCQGCDGYCNMTCKGGCGSNHANQGPV